MPARGGSRFTLDGVLIVTAAVLWSASVAWLVWGIGAASARLTVADLAEPRSTCSRPSWCCALCTGPVRASSPRVGGHIRAMLVYAAGDGLYAWFDLMAGGASSPSLADVAYVAYYPSSGPRSCCSRAWRQPGERLRLTLTPRSARRGRHGPMADALGAGSPDAVPEPAWRRALARLPDRRLILLFGVAALALRRPVASIPGRSWRSSAGSCSCSSRRRLRRADTGRGVQRPAWPDVGYLSSSLLIALPAIAGASRPHTGHTRARWTRRWLLALPYAGLAGGYGTCDRVRAGERFERTTRHIPRRPSPDRANLPARSSSCARMPTCSPNRPGASRRRASKPSPARY